MFWSRFQSEISSEDDTYAYIYVYISLDISNKYVFLSAGVYEGMYDDILSTTDQQFQEVLDELEENEVYIQFCVIDLLKMV